MRLARFLRPTICFLLAATTTAAAYFVDTELSRTRRTQHALALARQMTSQIEILTLKAREKGESNPLNWVIQALSVGTDPRPIQLSALANLQHPPNEIEKYRLHHKHGNFSYIKVLEPQTGTGLRIQIHLGYIGFLGAMTPWINDLWIIFFLTGIFLFLYKSTTLSKPTFQKSVFEPVVYQWADEAKSGLMHLGINLKNVIKEAQLLASAAAKSRDNVEILTNQSNEIRDAAADMENSMLQGEENMDKLRDAINRFKELNEKTIEITQNAWDSYSEVFSVTQNLNGNISKTTEALLAEAKLIQSIKAKFNELEPDQKSADSTK